jgi:hypothetical protein
MTIHTFGDSHCRFGFDKSTYGVKTNGISAVTMQNFGRFKLDVLDVSQFNVQEGDYVCFSFGEIDCRCHIHKFKEQYKELIEKIVENYMDAIKENANKFSDLKVMVYNVPPTLRASPFNWNTEYPMLGSNEERITYIKYMNEKLKENCKKNNFIFFDVYDSYVGEDGFMKYELSDGRIHIDNPIYIDEFFKNIIK